jgi:hypothetical protein
MVGVPGKADTLRVAKAGATVVCAPCALAIQEGRAPDRGSTLLAKGRQSGDW